LLLQILYIISTLVPTNN